jgi:hypothetical protein
MFTTIYLRIIGWEAYIPAGRHALEQSAEVEQLNRGNSARQQLGHPRLDIIIACESEVHPACQIP